MYCQNCGKEIENDCNFCKHCGQSVNGPIKNNKMQTLIEIVNHRISLLDTSEWSEDEKHLHFIVVSKNKQSIYHIKNELREIDLYDCFAIIALLRCDCRNGFGYHYNSFYNLGFWDCNLDPIPKIDINGKSITRVYGTSNTPAWGGFEIDDENGKTIHVIIPHPKGINLPQFVNWDKDR